MKTQHPKVALVTGASSGIGAAVARRLAADGFSVMAAARDAKRTNELAAETPLVRAWIGDLATSEACSKLVADCLKAFGRLDVLVNNAGIYHLADAGHTTDEIWNQTIAINLTASFFLSRAALPALRKNKGAIINIASDWGLVGGRNAVAYCASKGGLVLMSKAMALDHAVARVAVEPSKPVAREHLERVTAELLSARRSCGVGGDESEGPALRDSLYARALEISSSAGGKKVEFRVTVEEGKPKIKAVLR